MSERHAENGAEDSASQTPADDVGSVGEEALRLIRALSTQRPRADPGAEPQVQAVEQHACPTGWCPICQVAGFVRDNPEAIDRVAASAGTLITALRDLVDAAITPQERP